MNGNWIACYVTTFHLYIWFIVAVLGHSQRAAASIHSCAIDRTALWLIASATVWYQKTLSSSRVALIRWNWSLARISLPIVCLCLCRRWSCMTPTVSSIELVGLGAWKESMVISCRLLLYWEYIGCWIQIKLSQHCNCIHASTEIPKCLEHISYSSW